MKLFTYLSGSIFLIGILISCTGSTKELVTTTNTANGIFPVWFNSSGFSTDSSSFYAYGMAIAADSTDALDRATTDAQNKLSYQLGKRAEEVRLAMVDDNISASNNTDFILLLRNAHSTVAPYAKLDNSLILTPEMGYRALVKISVSKQEAHTMFKNGFNGHPRYWAAFSGAEAYRSMFLK